MRLLSLRRLEEDVDEHQRHGDDEDRGADHVDLRRRADARGAPDEDRERDPAPALK